MYVYFVNVSLGVKLYGNIVERGIDLWYNL